MKLENGKYLLDVLRENAPMCDMSSTTTYPSHSRDTIRSLVVLDVTVARATV